MMWQKNFPCRKIRYLYLQNFKEFFCQKPYSKKLSKKNLRNYWRSKSVKVLKSMSDMEDKSDEMQTRQWVVEILVVGSKSLYSTSFPRPLPQINACCPPIQKQWRRIEWNIVNLDNARSSTRSPWPQGHVASRPNPYPFSSTSRVVMALHTNLTNNIPSHQYVFIFLNLICQ